MPPVPRWRLPAERPRWMALSTACPRDMIPLWASWAVHSPAVSASASVWPFLHDAPFLLLDEPTSNLDSLNEGIILKAVRDECREKTVLLVSHRRSTMAVAGLSFSVESGRLS